MKKTIYLTLCILVLMISTAVAQNSIQEMINQHESVQQRLKIKEQMQDKEQMQEFSGLAEQNIIAATISKKIESNVHGLENAMIHVDNTNAISKLQRNLEQFQNRYQYRYENYDITEVDGETYVRARKQFRFLIFNFNIDDEYHIDEAGDIIKESRGFWSRLFIRAQTQQ